MITGMPIGRRCPLALGTYTRLTGRARQGADWLCIKFTSSVFSSEVETVLLSIPAVSRPALTSVTRLTLTSVLAKLRSISFGCGSLEGGSRCGSACGGGLPGVRRGLLPATFLGVETRMAAKKEPGASIRIRHDRRGVHCLTHTFHRDGGLVGR